MRLLVHLAGDVPEMAAAELRAVFDANGTPFTTLRETARFLDGHAEVFADEVNRLLDRLGLSHHVAMHLFDGVPGHWSEGSLECCFPVGIPFAARSTRVDPEAAWSGPTIEREVGELLSPGRPVDLKRPSLVARAFLLADRIYVGQQLWESDPKERRTRHVENRPHFSPVSLEPRLARALVNLAQARPGERLYDPFCGTGGLLLEAATIGAKVIGSDLDPEMVEGCRTNLEHYGHHGDLFAADIGDAADALAARGLLPVDAVACDLPYGRSASTGKEAIQSLYGRTLAVVQDVLRPGARAVVGVPDPLLVGPIPPGLSAAGAYAVRAHRSLTRHFLVYQKAPQTVEAAPATGSLDRRTF